MNYQEIREKMRQALQRRGDIIDQQIALSQEHHKRVMALEKTAWGALEEYRSALKNLTMGDSGPDDAFKSVEVIFDFAEQNGVEPVWFYQQLSQAMSYVNNWRFEQHFKKPKTEKEYYESALRGLAERTKHGPPPGYYDSDLKTASALLGKAINLAKPTEKEGSNEKMSVVYQFLIDKVDHFAFHFYLQQNRPYNPNDR